MIYQGSQTCRCQPIRLRNIFSLLLVVSSYLKSRQSGEFGAILSTSKLFLKRYVNDGISKSAYLYKHILSFLDVEIASCAQWKLFKYQIPLLNIDIEPK